MDIDNSKCPGPLVSCGDSGESMPAGFFDEGRSMQSWEHHTPHTSSSRPYEPQGDAWLKAYPKQRREPGTKEERTEDPHVGEPRGRLTNRSIIPHYEKGSALITGMPRYLGFSKRETDLLRIREMIRRQEQERASLSLKERGPKRGATVTRDIAMSNFQPRKSKTGTGGNRPPFNIDKMIRRELIKGKNTNSFAKRPKGAGTKSMWSSNWAIPRTKAVTK